jgi:hypothetical protein
MTKTLELSDPQSCFNRARPNELMFVVLERDAAAPHAIREWIKKRIELGKNLRGDPQLLDAEPNQAIFHGDFAPIPVLVTVEYEERHAGLTAPGVEDLWFPRIEAFKRIGLLDNPTDQAAKFISIISRRPDKFRRISPSAWEPAR